MSTRRTSKPVISYVPQNDHILPFGFARSITRFWLIKVRNGSFIELITSRGGIEGAFGKYVENGKGFRSIMAGEVIRVLSNPAGGVEEV
jgi:hypothetical protein